MDKTTRIKEKAHELGFELVGIAPALPPPDYDYFRWWLDQGYAGTMEYLKRGSERRGDPALILPGVQSVICCGINYYTGDSPSGNLPSPIALYAWGKDYHEVVLEKLALLEEFIQAEVDATAQTKCYVDTGAILERSYAAQAGLGWVGKNTCLINNGLGSYFFLGEILTTLKLNYDHPTFDQCGTCTKCLDACPTGALVEEYQMDARRCISYLTIEYRGEFTEEQKKMVGNHVYGCDICQEVCPYNQRIPTTPLPDFQPTNPLLPLTQEVWNSLDEVSFKRYTQDTAMERIRLSQWKRNILRILLPLSICFVFPALHAQSFLEKLGEQAKETLITDTARDVSGTAGARGLGEGETPTTKPPLKKQRRKRIADTVKETLETKTAQDVSGTAGVRGLTLQPETAPKKPLKTD